MREQPKARRFYVITGGTYVHVAPHFSLCAPAFGQVGESIGRELKRLFKGPAQRAWEEKLAARPAYGSLDIPSDELPYADRQRIAAQLEEEERLKARLEEESLNAVAVRVLRTTMAGGAGDQSTEIKELYRAAGIQRLETNDDLEKLLDHLVTLPETKGIVLAAAVCDWKFRYIVQEKHTDQPYNGDLAAWASGDFGKSMPRFKTSNGELTAALMPTDKLIDRIRRTRKDIFLVGFKATTGLGEQEQYLTGLGLLKGASCNLVLANDVHEHRNMVITPEEAKYHVTKDRDEAIRGLCEMIVMRSRLTFTRSKVVDGPAIPWASPDIPANLRAVVDHCIARGAYKPFRGKTVGHFATRGPTEGVIYTSRRKSNFNKLESDGLLRVEAVGDDEVVAYGGKPSVGGQSQRIIFSQHPDVDCIVHAHVPLREDRVKGVIPVRPQRPYECGSHECGRNTSEGLAEVRDGIKAVMLDEHGPNICFSRDADPAQVIKFIETYWDLGAKTGGPVELG
jgi:hypothetical protein